MRRYTPAAALLLGVGLAFVFYRAALFLIGSPAGGPAVEIFFTGGFDCGGRLGELPPPFSSVALGTSTLAFDAGDPRLLVVPAALLKGLSPELRISAPGWGPAILKLPPLAPGARHPISEVVRLERSRGVFSLLTPRSGSDYDFAELEWIKPLESEPNALPAAAIDFAADPNVPARECRVATGVYRLVLKSRSPLRVRDFVLTAALSIGPETAAAPPQLSFPVSLSRGYVGFAGLRSGPPGSQPVGIFCGLRIDVRSGGGAFKLVFDTPTMAVIDYPSLLPRPDNEWPISNVFLEDPASVSFDCPLSHVDHRIVMDRSDGIITMLAKPLPPENDSGVVEQLSRMRALLRLQAQYAARYPGSYDSRYAGFTADRLPNARYLESSPVFSKYAARVADGPATVIELGRRLRIRSTLSSGWSVEIVRAPEDWR